MQATISDLSEPIQSVIDRIPVQEMLEKVPHDVREHLPERFRPDTGSSRRRMWMTILVLVGLGAIVVMAKRRASHSESTTVDLRETDMSGVSVMDRAETAGMPLP